MKRFLLFTTLSAILCLFTACSNDDEDMSWFYGDEQELVDTEWYGFPIVYGRGNIVPGYTLTFGTNDYTITKDYRGSITTFDKGTYEYKHPKLLLKTEVNGNSPLNGHISPLNRICFEEGELNRIDFKKQ